MRQEVGDVAQERIADFAVRARFLDEESAVLVWSRVPRCVGGPPPGYFGEFDAGSCYAGDEIVIKRLPASAYPELAACFAAATVSSP